MANTITSPNMLLPVPVVGVDPNPDWANNLNACLNQIDAHNHTSSAGVQIPPGGLNINSDLTFQGNNATNLRSSRYTVQSVPLSASSSSDVGCVYVSGVDLYYNDVNGNQIRITQTGGIAGSPGSISNLSAPASASYVSGNQTFVWQSNTNTPANMDGASYILRNLTSGSKGLTLSPPAAMAADYGIVLPALPATQNFLVMDNAGTITAPVAYANGLTSSNIQVGGITGASIAANTIPTSKIISGQQIPLLTVSKIADYTIDPNDALILCNTGTSAFTLTLYSASANPGYTTRIKKTSSDIRVVTVAGAGGQTIDGAATTTVASQNEILTLTSDGSNWQIVDRNYPQSWTSATFGFSGGITAADQDCFIRRIGDSLEGRINFNNMTVQASAAKLGLPFGLLINASKLSSGRMYCGIYNRQANTGLYFPGSGAPSNSGTIFVDTGSLSSLSMSFQAAAVNGGGYSTFTMNSFFVTGDGLSVQFSVPITGWS